MKLTLPPPQITLYEDGLQSHDKLDRKPLADRLSKLLESIDDPLVVALDGGWGSGKSVFLQCWVGEHLREKSHTATTLYFDAFENDYLDDPLIALTGALTDRLGKSGRKPALLKKLKTAAFRIAPMAARLGLAAVTAGGTEAAGAIGDALINQSAKDVEKAAEAYWKREDGRRAAMQQFRDALKALTEPDNDGTPQKKLVIVIDELDRCRPDYALQLLEVIKHFFATPGVHFVLGVNLHELANSVRARYGAGINAERYLHKFVQIRMPMIPARSIRGTPGEASLYFQHVVERIPLGQYRTPRLQAYVSMLSHHANVTLRDVEKIVTLTVVVPIDDEGNDEVFLLLAGLIIIQVIKPDWINRARLGELSFEEVTQLFKLERNRDQTAAFKDIYWLWRYSLDRVNPPETGNGTPPDAPHRISKFFDRRSREEVIPDIIATSLDAFELPE